MDSKIQNYADAIVVRENVGYDIGAYKCVILSPYYNRIVKESDELILCNSSFYGPFISMDQILKKMECSDSDFWGISSSEKNMVQHIQSYFLVLRNKILKGEELFNYLNNHVDVRKIDYYKACNIFENGLFWELRNAGYIFDAYKRNIDCDNYFNPYGSLKIDGLPILKKKIFSKDFFEKENVLNALAYVKEKYSYNIKFILEDAYKNYGVRIIESELIDYPRRDAEVNLFLDSDMVSRKEIEDFINLQKSIFLYGNGRMAKHIYNSFIFYENNPKLKGFIVSDDQLIVENDFMGYPIYHLSEVENKIEQSILVALNKKNTQLVKCNLDKFKMVKTLWK